MTADHTVVGPFRGLAPFGADDARYFVGREDECDAIFDCLFASRLTIVYGDSGVGKSSILRAGVASKIQRHDLSDPVVIWDWKGPASDVLAHAIATLGVARTSGEAMDAWLRRVVEDRKRYLMVILDQFEDVISDRTWTDSDDGRRLLDSIAALSMTDGGVSFIVALRADALADADRLLRRVELEMTPELYRVEPMRAEGVERAIREPVRRWAEDHQVTVRLEDELVKGVVEEIPGSAVTVTSRRAGTIDLPFLQIVMKRIWDQERGTSPASEVLRASTLRQLGGTEKIIRDHVKRILDGLSTADQRVADRVLGQLISPTGNKVAFSKTDLAQLTRSPARDVASVVDHLSAPSSRLLRADPGVHDSVYELFHDRLVPPVTRWREDHRTAESRRDRRRTAGITAVAAALVTAAITFAAISVARDDGPPRADVESVTISGLDVELDGRILHDGDDNTTLVIPLDGETQFKLDVKFPEVTDIVDVQVVASTDDVAPQPTRAYISQTEIQVPVGDAPTEGRGAYGRTDHLTIVVEARATDAQVQVAELKFWRHEP